MTAPRDTPPWLAVRLLQWRVPEHDREYLVGDLLEAFEERQARDGRGPARRFFWRETLHVLSRPWPASLPPIATTGSTPEDSMQSFLQTVRFAARSLLRSPSLTALVVITLGLGIGTTTSVYSVARAALFASPPYPASERITTVWERDRDGRESNMGYATFLDLSRERRVFESSAAMSYWLPTLNDGTEATRVVGQRVTWQFFDVLGVTPMLGRAFTRDEDVRGANRVVILDHDLWRTRFGGDSAIVGRDITINGVDYEVAGVLPPGFESLLAPGAQLWSPLGYDESLPWACRTCRHLRVVGRLRPDVSASQAAQVLDASYLRLRERFPTEYAGAGVALTSVHEFVVRGTRPAMLALLVGVGLVALIACFNAAHLLLGRALRREGEFALRVALGASRGRLAAMLLIEGSLVALAAAGLGIALAIAGMQVVLALAPDGIPRLDRVTMDGRTLAFTVTLALATGLAASVIPAWALLRHGLQDGIRDAARSIAGHGRHRVRNALVAGEVALAVILVSGTSMLYGSMTRLLAVDGGFATANRVTMELALSGPAYTDSGSVDQAWGAVLDAVHAVPGVRAATLASQIPLGGNVDLYGLHLEGADRNPANAPYGMRYAVTPRYLETMGIPLRAGRALMAADVAGAPRAVLINEAAAAALFPGENPLGRRFRIGGGEGDPWSVVGVVGNTVHRGLDGPVEFQMYVPSAQWGEEGGLTLVVHSAVDPRSVTPAIRSAITRAIPGIAISNVATLERLVARSTADRRFALALFAGFAGVALVLAMAGLFGVLSATVVERTREIGVRTALGALPGRILAMVVRQGLILTGVGLAVGLLATWGSGRVLSTLLYGTGAADPFVLAAVVGSLGVAALLACALPAWRASRVDPMIALRE